MTHLNHAPAAVRARVEVCRHDVVLPDHRQHAVRVAVDHLDVDLRGRVRDGEVRAVRALRAETAAAVDRAGPAAKHAPRGHGFVHEHDHAEARRRVRAAPAVHGPHEEPTGRNVGVLVAVEHV